MSSVFPHRVVVPVDILRKSYNEFNSQEQNIGSLCVTSHPLTNRVLYDVFQGCFSPLNRNILDFINISPSVQPDTLVQCEVSFEMFGSPLELKVNVCGFELNLAAQFELMIDSLVAQSGF